VGPRVRRPPAATVGWRLALLAYFEGEGGGAAEDALPPAALPPTARAALAAAVRRAAAARVGPARAEACVGAFEANWTALAAGEAAAAALDDEGDRAELDALVARHGLVPGHYGDLELLHGLLTTRVVDLDDGACEHARAVRDAPLQEAGGGDGSEGAGEGRGTPFAEALAARARSLHLLGATNAKLRRLVRHL